MTRRPPRSTRTDTRFPDPTRFRADPVDIDGGESPIDIRALERRRIEEQIARREVDVEPYLRLGEAPEAVRHHGDQQEGEEGGGQQDGAEADQAKASLGRVAPADASLHRVGLPVGRDAGGYTHRLRDISSPREARRC